MYEALIIINGKRKKEYFDSVYFIVLSKWKVFFPRRISDYLLHYTFSPFRSELLFF